MSSSIDYDDEREQARYVCFYFGRMMTELEGRVEWAIFAQRKRSIGYDMFARFIEKRHLLTDDAAVHEALADGVDTFRKRVCKRILTEHGGEVIVNRCPKCNRVARTPKSRQCFWCGHDWHDSAK